MPFGSRFRFRKCHTRKLVQLIQQSSGEQETAAEENHKAVSKVRLTRYNVIGFINLNILSVNKREEFVPFSSQVFEVKLPFQFLCCTLDYDKIRFQSNNHNF